jgi:hypothetical protein
MPNPAKDYALDVYENVLNGGTWTGTITKQAEGWRRSIRRKGGFWDGRFKLRDDRGVLEDFFNTQMMAHFEEKCGGSVTWEGFIADMDAPVEDRDGWYLDVGVDGYVHTLGSVYVSVGDNTTGDASVWVNDVLGASCEYVAAKAISTNTLQVLRSNANAPRVWDELSRIAELGDGTGAPWRFYMDVGRRAVYAADSTAVAYYVNGGIRRRRSWSTMWNAVGGSYIDDDDKVQALTVETNAESVRRFGRREQRMYRDGLPMAAADALRDTYLKENGYPWPRPVGTIGTVDLYTSIGDKVSVLPWRVLPGGVIRDLSYTVGGSDYGGWLQDQRDFMVDEVVADEKGVSLRTWLFSDADLLEAQLSYAKSTKEMDFDLRD